MSASWALDLEQYNEWMAEEDYEVDEQGRKKIHKLRCGVDDLMSSGPDDKAKKTQIGKSKRKRSPSPSRTAKSNKTILHSHFQISFQSQKAANAKAAVHQPFSRKRHAQKKMKVMI